MDAEVKKIWVEALRSGDYKQTEGQLKDTFGFCCLGVLCDVYAEKVLKQEPHWIPPYEDTEEKGINFFSEDAESLPWQLAKALNLDSSRKIKGPFDEESRCVQDVLADLNDTRAWDFKQIADFIEENL
jgi:hypothetical protein